jgi:beta-N-acetylhexosaminidase
VITLAACAGPLGGSSSDGQASAPSLRELIGQRLMVRFSGTRPSASLVRRFERGELGGVIVFPENVRSRAGMRSLVGVLTRACARGGHPPPLVAIDQEGGEVKRLPGPPDRSPRALGRIGSAAVAEREGARTGSYLRSFGINVDLAPVVDVPARDDSFIRSRSFSSSPAVVSRLGSAFARGLQGKDVAATAKHFPGLGYASANTDFASVEVRATRDQLAPGLAPFRALDRAGARLVMVGSAIYPAYDRGTLAVFSRPIVTTLLRGQIGFDGVVITDDLQARAVASRLSPARAALAAASADADLLLFARTPSAGIARDVLAALERAVRRGRLGRGQLERSYGRIAALKQDLAR